MESYNGKTNYQKENLFVLNYTEIKKTKPDGLADAAHKLDVQISKNSKTLGHYYYDIDEKAKTMFLGGLSQSEPKAIAKYFVNKLLTDLKSNKKF